jgi:protein-disulfide isomerase
MAELNAPVTQSDHISGSPEASVVIVEYGDYQCPYCGQAYSIAKSLQRKFGEDLCLVFRNFPLTQVHAMAAGAAQAAEAAGAQGKFWEMHDLLYEHQEALDFDDLVSYAQELGLDVDRFGADVRNGAATDKITQDVHGAIQSGVNGTPTFFLNGVRVDDSWDFDMFSAMIERQLGVASKRSA